MFIAQKRLKVGHDEQKDTPIYREVDEAVPEADTWPWQVLATYLREGHLREAADPVAAEAPARKRTPKGTTHA